MTREEAMDIIKAERECVYRQGRTGECCRDDLGCGACDLVQEDVDIIEAYDMAIEALGRGSCWRLKPLPRATHCIVAIKWAEDDIEVTEADTTFLLKEHSENIVAWMPLPDPPKGGDS
jgi:hypothetical protein